MIEVPLRTFYYRSDTMISNSIDFEEFKNSKKQLECR